MKYINTYLEYINEERSNEWIEITDNIGNTHNMRTDTIKIKVLRFIYESGNDGRRYTDIVKYIVENLNGDTYNYKIHRGYWATNLLGSNRYQGNINHGILYQYCEKNQNNKWVLTNKQLIAYFMNTDLRGILDIDEIEALSELL